MTNPSEISLISHQLLSDEEAALSLAHAVVPTETVELQGATVFIQVIDQKVVILVSPAAGHHLKMSIPLLG